MYRWSLDVVQPLRISSAIAVSAEMYTASLVSPAQMGYRVFSQLNRLESCAIARVRVWYMWWWVLTIPGMTMWPLRSMISSASDGSSLVGPTCSMTLSRMNTPPSEISRRSRSMVTSVCAWRTRTVPISSSSLQTVGGDELALSDSM